MENIIEVPFRISGSEVKDLEYTIPEGYEAEIKEGKVIIRQAESEDEKIMKELLIHLEQERASATLDVNRPKWQRTINWVKKQGEQKPIEEKAWTINDAKDGDVLNSVRVQATIIFKGFADDGKHILAYCALQKGIFISQEMFWDRDFGPASEYWKNALYDAMTAKGYEWDAEKKELKKIEQKPAEWSEEDENSINKLLAICSVAKRYRQFAGCDQELVTKLQNWLKALKERCTSQPHWKPTEAMLKALKWAKSEFHPDCQEMMSNLNYLYKEIEQLYYDRT